MVWPERTLNLQRVPEVHAIVVSHRHADHFDPPSLALFPRATPIVIPDDQLLLATIAELGFERVVVAQSMAKIQIGDLTLIPTPAAPGAVENGYIVASGNAKVWNLIDTVPVAGDVAMVNALAGPFDLAIVPWQPLIDMSYSQGKGIEFPLEHYKRLIENALHIDARQLALGACGFRATPEFSYLNDAIFPVSASRVISDLRAASGGRICTVLSPVAGDLVEIYQQIKLHRQVLGYCRSRRQLAGYRWSPCGHHLRERSSLELANARHAVAKRLAAFFDTELPQFMDCHREEFHFHRLRASVFEYTVHFGDGDDTWFVSFTRSATRVCYGGRRQSPTTAISITADALFDLLSYRSSWSRVVQSANYIAIPMGYRVCSGEVVAVDDAQDPLKIFFAGDNHAAKVARAVLPALGT